MRPYYQDSSSSIRRHKSLKEALTRSVFKQLLQPGQDNQQPRKLAAESRCHKGMGVGQ